MQTKPPSAKTNAPAFKREDQESHKDPHFDHIITTEFVNTSTTKVCVTGSFITLAVRPAAEEPLPLVYIAIGEVFVTNFRICDFPTPGSPIQALR